MTSLPPPTRLSPRALNSTPAMSPDQPDPVGRRISGVRPSRIRSPTRIIPPQEDHADELDVSSHHGRIDGSRTHQRGPMMSVNPAKPTPLEDKFILTSEEAAEFLGVSLRTIRYWVATRRIPYFHLGRFIRFKPADLTAFLESGRVEPLEREALDACGGT